MDRDIIEKYKSEMLSMYKKTKKENIRVAPVVAQTTEPQTSGKLLAVVTTVRTLYPVPNAKVTVFTGDYKDMNVIDTALTDNSGRTREFVLSTPQKELSLESENTKIPYAVYNLMVEADGYVPNIHLNIPVFSGVTSIQGSNLMLKETAGANMDVQIFDEAEKYDL